MNIEDLRIEINKIDEKIAKLFEERMELVSKIAIYKKENSLTIEDKNREQEILEKSYERVKSDLVKYHQELEKKLIELSKEYQKEVLK